MAQVRENCRHCEPIWNLKNVSLTCSPLKAERGLAGDGSWKRVDIAWEASLEQLNCKGTTPMNLAGGVPARGLRLPGFVAVTPVVGEPGRFFTQLKSLGLTAPPIRFYGLIDLKQKTVCCKQGFTNSLGESCCKSKRDLICNCYANSYLHPNHTTTMAECTMKGIISRAFAIHEVANMDLEIDKNVPLINALLERELAKIAGRGMGPQSCTGATVAKDIFAPISTSEGNKWNNECPCFTISAGIIEDDICPI